MGKDKSITRLEKSTKIVEQSKTIQWCYVNTENEFIFMDKKYIISEEVEDYKVYNKAGSVYDYTNEAYMEEILATIDNSNNLIFYNQNYDYIDSRLVSVVWKRWILLKLSNLIHEVWKDERVRHLRIRKDEIKIIINVIIEKIGEGLISNKLVKIQGLFTLELRKAKGRRIRNPQSGEEMYSSDYYKIGLKPAKKIKDELKKIKK